MAFHSINHYGPNLFAHFYEALPLMSRDRITEVCKLLDITPQTLKKYLSGKSNPPKCMVRVLFFESHYGQDAIATDTFNQMIVQKALAEAREKTIDKLLAHIEILEAENAEFRLENTEPRFVAANATRWA